MAVYTDITRDDVSLFLAEYDTGKLVSYESIAEGVENSNFRLQTSKEVFILTLFERRVTQSDLPFFLGLMSHLSMQGLSCPTPVPRKDGISHGYLSGRPAALVSFLKGDSFENPNVKQCYQVGKALARIHISADGFEISRPNTLSIDGWQMLWGKLETRANQLQQGLQNEIGCELNYLLKFWPTTLPSGIIHADLFPDNVLFHGDDISGVIDFYFACSDFFAYDIAIMLNAWCFEACGSYDAFKGSALLKGYNSVRSLNPDELVALPILSRGAALRFFLTRLYDVLDTPEIATVKKKDPMEYLAKLRYHREVRSFVEYEGAHDA